MVAVKMIDWLTAAEGTDEVTAVVVEVLPTVCTSAIELLRVKFASPLYFATTLCELAVRNVWLQTGTTPAANVAGAHKLVDVELSTKVTVPVGNAAPGNVGVTTAVKATCWLAV